MLVKTLNSTYQIQATGKNFKVTKIADGSNVPNPAVKTNESFEANSIYVRVGERARLGDISTSPVMEVTD